MNFEIAPAEYHRILSFNEAKLYLFALNIDNKTGWRIPSRSEYNTMISLVCWQEGDLPYLMDHEKDTLRYLCVPTRTID
jgi:hypothetical protein